MISLTKDELVWLIFDIECQEEAFTDNKDKYNIRMSRNIKKKLIQMIKEKNIRGRKNEKKR